jgi:small subunit ribosomal protein S21
MLIVKIIENEPIDRALKKFKRKEQQTKLLKELRERTEFVKPSVYNRKKIQKAVYVNKKKLSEEK